MSNKREALEAALKDANDPHIGGLQKTTIALIEAALAEPEQEPVDVLAMPDTALGRTWDIDRLIFRLSLTKREEPSLVSACWTAKAILVRIQKLGKLYTSPREWQELNSVDISVVCAKAEKALGQDENLSWRKALIAEASAALRAKNGG